MRIVLLVVLVALVAAAIAQDNPKQSVYYLEAGKKRATKVIAPVQAPKDGRRMATNKIAPVAPMYREAYRNFLVTAYRPIFTGFYGGCGSYFTRPSYCYYSGYPFAYPPMICSPGLFIGFCAPRISFGFRAGGCW